MPLPGITPPELARPMFQTFEELVKWLHDRGVLVYRDKKRYLVFPNRSVEVGLEQFGKGIHRPYKFRVGDEELCCAYPRRMRRYLLAWWAGFSMSLDVNQ